MTAKLTPEERATTAKAREIERIGTTYEEKLSHYPAEERELIVAVFLALPRFGKTGMDAAVARLIRRNFIACEPKIGWQDAARLLLDHAGKVSP